MIFVRIMRHPESGEVTTSPQISEHTPSTLLITVTLLGCLCVGTNLAVLLHGAGHAIGALVAGGEVMSFTVHPFSGSRVGYKVPPNYRAYILCIVSFAVIVTELIIF